MKYLSFIVFVLLVQNSFAQIEWTKVVGGSDVDYFNTLIQRGTNDWVLFGSTNSLDGDFSSNYGNYDVFFATMDASGNIDSIYILDGNAEDQILKSLLVNDSMCYFVVNSVSQNGPQYSTTLPGMNIWVKSFSPDGTIMPGFAIGGNNTDLAYDYVKFNSGFAIVGTTYSNDTIFSGNHGSLDGFILRFDNSMNLVFAKCYGDAEEQIFYKIAELNGGYMFIVGSTRVMSVSNPTTWLVKTNSLGDTISTIKTVGSNGSNINNMTYRNDSIVYISGYTTSQDGDFANNSDSCAGFVMQVNAQLMQIDTTVFFGGNNSTIVNDVLIWNDSVNLVLTSGGATTGIFASNYGQYDHFLFAIDKQWNVLGYRQFGGSNYDGFPFPNSIRMQKTDDGKLLIVTNSMSTDHDLTTNNGSLDGWLIKYNPAELLVGIETENPLNIELFPNPADEYFCIVNPFGTEAIISVFSINGQKFIHQPISGRVNYIPTRNLSPGIYIVNFESTEGNVQQKLVIE